MQSTHSKEKEFEDAGKKVIDSAASTIREGEEKVKEFAAGAQKKIKEGQEKLKDIAYTLDKQLHENPWPIVASIAAVSLFLGFIVGTTKRNS